MIKLIKKFKQWLAIVNDINKLKEKTKLLEEKNEILESKINDSIKKLSYATKECNHATEIANECRKTMNAVCDVGVDVGLTNHHENWAVICIHGKMDYVKFIPMTQRNVVEITQYLKRFEYSNMKVDSPFGFVDFKRVLL